MDSHRSERVSEALREELGELIAYELSDPRIGEAVVTEVLRPDGAIAETNPAGTSSRRRTLAGLGLRALRRYTHIHVMNHRQVFLFAGAALSETGREVVLCGQHP